jgi:HSP20 family protein
MSTLTKFSPFRGSVWDPFREIGDLENRLEKYFGKSLAPGNGGKETMSVAEWAPVVDITEDAKEYLVKAELPEIKKEDVKVSVENGELSISGERKFEKEEKGKKYHRIERSYGSFLRSFTLPETTDATKVNAEFKDGVLTIHLPKNEKATPKAVEVKVQ